jgi:CheY-like chemotaxis protein
LGEHVELVVNVAPDAWPILFDPALLEQVLLNLALNARYAVAGGGTLTIDVSNLPEDAPGTNHVRIRVSDDGVGMTPDTLLRVFEPFFTTKPRGEGSGMGLASTYGMVTGAGGTIEIASQPGQGTTVTVVLPSCEEVREERAPLSGVASTEPGGGGETVLLVEDDDVLREAIRRILSKNGFQVFPCANGTEALHILRNAHTGFDVLLTDVVMPKMHGPELANLIREEQPGIRVLFMSGYAAGALGPTNRLDEGCVLLKKPFGQEQLLTKLRQVLASEVELGQTPEYPAAGQQPAASTNGKRSG